MIFLAVMDWSREWFPAWIVVVVLAREFLVTGIRGYVESQGAFAERLAREMRPRLGIPCALSTGTQVDFSEPRTRQNTMPLCPSELGWEESSAWDELADYYVSGMIG